MSDASFRSDPVLVDVAAALCRDAMPAEILRRKRDDAMTVRADAGDGRTVVAKLWRRTGWRCRLRPATTAAPAREWGALRRLHGAGVAVPAPLACLRGLRGGRFTDAVVMADLGPGTRTSEHLGHLRAAGRDGDAAAVEAAVIAVTARMLDLGVTDADHTLMNFLSTPDGATTRLDLELARCRRTGPAIGAAAGETVGRLLGSYLFVVHPDEERLRDFADRVRSATNLDPHGRRAADARLRRMAERQAVVAGTDVVCSLAGWAS